MLAAWRRCCSRAAISALSRARRARSDSISRLMSSIGCGEALVTPSLAPVASTSCTPAWPNPAGAGTETVGGCAANVDGRPASGPLAKLAASPPNGGGGGGGGGACVGALMPAARKVLLASTLEGSPRAASKAATGGMPVPASAVPTPRCAAVVVDRDDGIAVTTPMSNRARRLKLSVASALLAVLLPLAPDRGLGKYPACIDAAAAVPVAVGGSWAPYECDAMGAAGARAPPYGPGITAYVGGWDATDVAAAGSCDGNDRRNGGMAPARASASE